MQIKGVAVCRRRISFWLVPAFIFCETSWWLMELDNMAGWIIECSFSIHSASTLFECSVSFSHKGGCSFISHWLSILLWLTFLFLFLSFSYVCPWVHVTCVQVPREGKKKRGGASSAPKLELQTVISCRMWVLRTELVYSRRAAVLMVTHLSRHSMTLLSHRLLPNLIH